MSTHLLLEAAVRTLVMGAIIFLALHVLRIEQIRARRTAWLLALAGALAMPFLVAAHIGPPLLPEFTANRPVIVQSAPLTAAAMPAKTRVHDFQLSGSVQVPPAGVPNSYWVDRGASAEIVDAHLNVGGPVDHSGTWLTLAIIGYFAVAAVLALRLCAGVGFALRLRNQAKRVILPFDPDLDTRASLRLKTPVTIGSSVLLPRNFTLWDGPTLRIVLTHERAHVRQGDFYVHLLARLHCALFWFSPFSWWLLRQLSDLGEALSDCAAVEQAESRASYAETLLAFATQDHSPLAAVAMARSSNLSPRIERLLSDQRFERSFAPKQRLAVIAGGVVLIAMLAATATVRVNAAPNFVVTDTHSVSTAASADTADSQNTASAADTTPPAVPSPPTTPNPPAPTPRPPKMKHIKVVKDPAEADVGDYDVSGSIDEEEADRVVRDSAAEEVLAIRSGDSHIMINSGGSLDIHTPSSGDYIYFKHNGKPYLIQDPAILAKAQAMLAPTKELREKQRDLGRQQRALGQQQRALAAQERALAHDSAMKMVESAEFKRDMEDLRRQLKEIDLPQVTAQIDERALAEVQSHLAEIQSRVGRMQFQIGYKGEAFKDMGKFGEQMGKLGTEEGKLGEEQYKLGEQQRKIVEDATRQLKPIIEQAIRDGKAKIVSAE